jgi:SAM-dependent methyltransferase
MEEFVYSGNELEDFREAKRWKSYFSSRIDTAIGKQEFLLEVGAGIGANAEFLAKNADFYLGIEPDPNQVESAKQLYPAKNFRVGFLDDFVRPSNTRLCLVYIDVFEHICDDLAEMKKIEKILKPGETLVLLVPAHRRLFSSFDLEVGHFRRYERSDFWELSGTTFKIKKLEELDCLGFFLSLSSQMLRPNKLPSRANILLWDSLIPISRKLDFVTKRRLGKSILCIMERNDV